MHACMCLCVVCVCMHVCVRQCVGVCARIKLQLTSPSFSPLLQTMGFPGAATTPASPDAVLPMWGWSESSEPMTVAVLMFCLVWFLLAIFEGVVNFVPWGEKALAKMVLRQVGSK